ncbi:MAG: ComF family protein [Planctomycetota bacterium]
MAAWPYAGAAREIVLSLKYRARFAACGPAAASLAAALRAAGVPGDLLVPVPLSRARRRERGFNQSLLVARALARHLRIDLDARALWRRRHDPPQAGLPRGRRRRNPRGAFLARPRRVRRRSILLVDDVLTTGSTARACAIALRRAGAAAVVAAVLCRAEQR